MENTNEKWKILIKNENLKENMNKKLKFDEKYQ
jgi:hypothetical protein